MGFSTDFNGIKYFNENNLEDDVSHVDIYSKFGHIQNFYHDILNDSVNDQIKEGTIDEVLGKDFYNYVLINGEKFFKILQKYNFNITEISKEDLILLNKCCFYVGKGRNGRKFNHLSNCKELFKNKMKFRRICAKFSKIARLWDNGNGIICLHLFHETSHYMTHNIIGSTQLLKH